MTKDEVIETIQVWINKADDEFDREEQGRVAGLKMALSEIKKIQPCEDCISRAEAIRIASGHCAPQNIAKELRELPSVTPQPKTGKWLEKEVIDDKVIEEWQSARCSVCDKYHTTPYMYYFSKYNFCPNCGARMEVEE